MKNKNVQNFYVFLKEHNDVQEELKKEVSTLNGDEKKAIFAKFVEFGKKHGFEFTIEDLESSKDDLSDEELGNVNGGTITLFLTFTIVLQNEMRKPKK